VPITVTVPTGVIGPGFQIQLNSDAPSSALEGWNWVISVLRESDETAVVRFSAPVQGPFISGTDYFADIGTVQQFALGLPTNTQTIIQTQLYDPSNVLVDSGNYPTPVTWDPTGMAWNVPSQVVGGGLTTEEHDELFKIFPGVSKTFLTETGVATATAIGDLIQHPPASLQGVFQPCETLTGSGTLILPAPVPGMGVYGAVLTAIEVPPGFGLVRGQIDHYLNRLVQLVGFTQQLVGGQEVPYDQVEVYLAYSVWQWSTQPTSVNYYVTPGVSMSLCWLVLL
jgi:hypothetical protein